jgi:hypothetical protein
VFDIHRESRVSNKEYGLKKDFLASPNTLPSIRVRADDKAGRIEDGRWKIED